MDKFEYFTKFLESIGQTSPEHKELLESVKTGVKLILEAEGDGFANILSKIPEFLANTPNDQEPEVLATRFINKYADKTIDAMSEAEYSELMAIIEETIAETLNVSTFTEAEQAIPSGEITRHYQMTYQTVTPESAEHGDFEEQGWADARGWAYPNDPETGVQEAPEPEEVTANPEYDENIVDEMVKVLRNAGATENSGDDKSYRTVDGDKDYTTGSDTYYNYHLIDFTPEELSAIAEKVK